jgi:hypothetical protein
MGAADGEDGTLLVVVVVALIFRIVRFVSPSGVLIDEIWEHLVEGEELRAVMKQICFRCYGFEECGEGTRSPPDLEVVRVIANPLLKQVADP